MAQVPMGYSKRVKKIEKRNAEKPFIKHKSTASQSIAELKKVIKGKKARKAK